MCYDADMSGASRLLLLGVLLGGLCPLSSRAQDIAAPSMANVDLETEEGKALERDREAVGRVVMLGHVMSMIATLETEGRDMREVLAAVYASQQSAIPPQMLEKCPPDYRKAYEAVKEEMGKLLDRMRREKMDDVQFLTACKEFYIRSNEISAAVGEKYRLKERGISLFEALNRKLRVLEKEEKIKLLQRMKDELIAGKMEIPGTAEDTDDEAGGRLNVFVR